MSITTTAILGFGKLGQVLLDTLQNNPQFKQKFQVVALWNRTHAAFENTNIPPEIKVCKTIEELLPLLPEIDLVIECSHPTVLQKYAIDILEQSNLFISSPTAFGEATFYEAIIQQAQATNHHCYISLGASIGIWDVIRLDQDGQLKRLAIEMKKHPESFKIKDDKAVQQLNKAMEVEGDVLVAAGNVTEINKIAPQNTNTMAVYALATKALGFQACTGRIIANRNMDSHIVRCSIETQVGLTIEMVRDNPANHGAVTGAATFNSFLNSLANHERGILYNHFVFC